MTLEVTVVTPSPQTGQPIAFHIVADDDQTIDRPCHDESFGDGGGFGCTQHVDCPGNLYGAYGPWTPPPTHDDHYDTVISHTYAKAGTYKVTFSFRSNPRCGDPPDPYYSEATNSVTVTVAG